MYGDALEREILLGTLHFARLAGLWWAVLAAALPSLPGLARLVVVMGGSVVLSVGAPDPPVGDLGVGLVLPELALGVVLSFLTAVFIEALQIAAQVVALQAGFAYATSFDPGSQTDAGLLPTLARGLALLLFFQTGLDREVVRLVAGSYDAIPLGAFLSQPVTWDLLTKVLSSTFTIAFRLAIPLVALLIAADIGFALLNRAYQQLPLIGLTFPLKLALWPAAGLVALPAAIWLTGQTASVYLRAVRQLLGAG